MTAEATPPAAERPTRGARLRRGLWRWTKRVVIALVVLLLLVRITHPLWLPPVLDRLVAGRGLALEYRDLDLSVLGGRVDLSRVTLAPRPADDADAEGVAEDAPAPEPIAVVEYVGLDLDVSALFTGNLVVHRAVVDGVRLEVERDADGTWNLERFLASGAEEAAPDDPDESEAGEVVVEEPAEAAPLDFGLPVRIEAAALHGLRVHLVDALAVPPLDTVFHLDAAIADAGDAEVPTRIDVVGGAPELLDALRVEARARLGERLLDVEADVAVSGVRARRLAPYLEALGVEPRAERIDFDAALTVDLVAREGDEVLTTGEVRVRDIRLAADAEETFAVDEVTLEIDAASTRAAVLPLVAVRGVRGNAARRADGVLRVAGLDLVGTGAAAEPPEEEGPEPETGGAPFALEIGRVAVEEVALAFDDASVTPPAALRVAATVEVRDLVLDPARPGVPAAVDVAVDLAEVGRFTVAGSAVPTGDELSAELAVGGTDLTFAAVAPYLAAAGLESTYASGALQLDLSASARTTPSGLDVQARVANIELSDGEARHFAFGEIAVEGVEVAANGDLRVAEVRLSGLDLPASTEEEGALRALGFRTVPAVAARSSPAAEAPAPEAVADTPAEGAQEPPPRIELGRLVWSDSSLRFAGRHLAQPVDVTLEDLTLTVTDLALGGDPALHEPRPAQLEVATSIPGLAESLGVSGEVLSRPGGLDVEARVGVTGSGLHLEAIEGLLADLGLESTLAAGAFDLRLDAAARQVDDRMLARAELSDVRFADGEVELLALDRLVVGEVDAGPDGVSVANVNVSGARTAASRRSDGALELLGIRVLPGGPPAEAAPPADGAAAPPPPDNEAAPAADAPPTRFALGRFELEGATVAWSDAAVEPPVDVALEMTAKVLDVVTGPDATPLAFDLGARVAGVLEELSLTGSARLAPANLELDATLAATGISADVLAGYVPPGIQVDLAGGRFDAHLVAGSRANEAGGRDARLELTELALRDTPDAEPLLALDALNLDATRLDGDAGVYEVERAVTEGLVIEVRRTAAGLKVPGVTIVPVPIEQAEDAVAAAADEATPDTPVEAVAPPEGDAGAAVGVATPPTIRLGALNLGLARLRFVDEVRGGAPLEASLALVTEESQLLCSPEPEELPPLRFAVVGAALPLVEGIRADLVLSPFLPEPEFGLEVGVNGVRGARLVEVLPELVEALDAGALEAGTFTATASGVLRASRRGPADFDLSRGFGAELAVRDVAWRARPDGEVLAGLERIDVDVRRVRPTTGDVHVGSVEIGGLVARAGQEAEGMRVAGVLLKTPPADPEGPDGSEDPEEPAELEDPSESAEPTVAEAPDVAALDGSAAVDGPEFRLDRLAVQGLDFEFVDSTVDPPMIVPIDDLEVDVRGFTTRAFEQPRAVTFRALVDAGAVDLAERTGADNLLSGVLGSVAGAVAGAEDAFELESRRVWDQLEVKGRLRFVPSLSGRVQLDLLGLELPAFAGAASAAGVEIGDGLVDTKLGLRFRGDDGLGLDLKTTASYLSLSEPSGGPISTYLQLPAPLDTVLFLLRDESGQQTIPLRLDIGAEGVSVPAVAGAAGRALGQVLADALSAAPLRLLSPLTDVAGSLGLVPDAPTAETVVVEYGPGVTLPAAEAIEPVGPLLAALRADETVRVVVQHELGGGDIAQAARLANPDPARSEELVTRLRDRKAALRREWGERAALTRAQYAVGAAELAEAGTAHLRELDLEVVATEAALDRVLDLLRPGAERRRGQRTRAAALALAELRLERLREALLRQGGRDLAQRLDFRRPRFAPIEDGAGEEGTGEEGAAGSDAGGRITLTPRRPE